jgi:hypothetical protein
MPQEAPLILKLMAVPRIAALSSGREGAFSLFIEESL